MWESTQVGMIDSLDDRQRAVLSLLVIGREVMVIEEIFRNACYGYQVSLINSWLSLGIIFVDQRSYWIGYCDIERFYSIFEIDCIKSCNVPDLCHFKNSYYYWTILDSLILRSTNSTDYIDLLCVSSYECVFMNSVWHSFMIHVFDLQITTIIYRF